MHNLIAALRATPPHSFDDLAQILTTQLAAQVIIWRQTAPSTLEPLTHAHGAPAQTLPSLPDASDQPVVLDFAQLGPSILLPFNAEAPRWISVTPPLEQPDLAIFHGLLEGWIGRIAAEQAYQQLCEQHKEHDETIALIAHDLKNPLTTIRGSAELLLRRSISENRPERDTRRLEIIIDQSDRMREFLGTLVNMARLKSGELPLEKQQLNLSELVETLVQALNAAMEPARIVLSAAEPVYVLADRRWMEQALANLLDNALKYSPLDSQVQIRIAPGAHDVTIEVRDDGIGIEAADLERIFQRFTRGRQSSRNITGSGLGLYTVQTVIRAHDGTIQAASGGLNQGSTFTIQLPIQTAASSTQHSQGGEDEQQI